MSDLPRDRPGEPDEPDEVSRPERAQEGAGDCDPELAPGVRWSYLELPEAYGKGWQEVDNQGDRPKIAEVRLTDERREHVLDGDATGVGTGTALAVRARPSFPKAGTRLDVARDPSEAPDWQPWNSGWLAYGNRDELESIPLCSPTGGCGPHGRRTAAQA